MGNTEDILAQCLIDLERGDSVEDCLARYPKQREELVPLLRAAERVRSTPDVGPSASFRQDARTRLMSKIEPQTSARERAKVAARKRSRNRQPLRLRVPVILRRLAMPAVAALTVLILLGAMGIGVVYASSESLPGDPLYPAKLVGERAQLILSPRATTDARLHLRFASERLQEARELAELGRMTDLETAMNGYVKAVTAADDILQRQHAAGEEVESLSAHLQEQVAQHQAVLSQVQEVAREEAGAAVERAMTASREAERRASELPEKPQGTPTETEQPTATTTPTATSGATERNQPVPSEPPGQTKTPEPPGQTRTPQPPGQTRTPEPLGQTRTPESPGQTKTPEPPGQSRTPEPPGQTRTPQPPGLTRTPEPPGRTRTPEPPGRTRTPQPPGQTRTPEPPGQTRTPQPPGLTRTPEPPGQTRTPQPPGQTRTPGPPSDAPPEEP